MRVKTFPCLYLLSFGWDSLNLVWYLQIDAVRTKGGEAGMCEGDSECMCVCKWLLMQWSTPVSVPGLHLNLAVIIGYAETGAEMGVQKLWACQHTPRGEQGRKGHTHILSFYLSDALTSFHKISIPLPFAFSPSAISNPTPTTAFSRICILLCLRNIWQPII